MSGKKTETRNLFSRINYLFRLSLFEVHRIYLFYQTRRDGSHLKSKFKNINFDAMFQKSYHVLKPYYKDYTSHVSPDGMAISLELASFILTFCQLIKPRTIADLGSGFSSFVFRYYAANAPFGINVWSVDDDTIWLAKTRKFLSANKVSTKNLLPFSRFQKMHQKYDLVLHDMGTMEMRLETVSFAIRLASSGGFIILDDMQLPMYAPTPKKIIKKSGFTAYSTRQYTKDRYGRFSYVVHASQHDLISWLKQRS